MLGTMFFTRHICRRLNVVLNQTAPSNPFKTRGTVSQPLATGNVMVSIAVIKAGCRRPLCELFLGRAAGSAVAGLVLSYFMKCCCASASASTCLPSNNWRMGCGYFYRSFTFIGPRTARPQSLFIKLDSVFICTAKYPWHPSGHYQ